MNIVTNLEQIIPTLPYVKKGKYNHKIGTFILIGGSSYKSIYFDKINVSEKDKFYRKFDYERKYPNINFQTNLSKYSTTFSFDRPTDLLNHNLYDGEKHKNIYIASLTNLTIKNYSVFLNMLFNYHKLKPPYIFIGFSEGGYDILCFSKYYSKCIKKIFFIDTPLLDKYMENFEKFRKNFKWLNDVREKKFSWNKNNNIDISNIDELKNIDVYNFEIKTYNIIDRLTIDDFPKNIPIIILWSPFYDSPTKISKEKMTIINKMNKELDKHNNIIYMYLNAPHQMERVIPITLSKFIIVSTISAF